MLKLALLIASPWLFYVVAANLLVMTPLLTRLTNRNPTKFAMSYGFVVTWWPGEVYVRDFRLSFSASAVAFELEIDEARADILLTELLRRRFHAEDVRARGVSWQFFEKGAAARFGTALDAAFPHIAGVIPFRLGPKPPPTGRPRKPWSVQLDRVDATLRELWVREYRWRGSGRASGDFEVVPMQSYWVGPAELKLEPGTLTVGHAQLSSSFGGEAVTVITPTPIVRANKLRMLSGLNVDGRFRMHVDDLAFAEVYGFDAAGSGDFELDAHVHGGRLSDGTAVKLTLPRVRWIHENGAGFDGTLAARFSGQVLSTESSGRLHLPGAVVADVPHLEGVLRLSTTDLAKGPRPAAFRIAARELRVPDATAVRAALKGRVPFVIPIVLGDAPLEVRGLELNGTPKKLVLGFDEATMGEVTARGELELAQGRASGAVEARVRGLGVGVALQHGKVKLDFFTKRGWLEQKLAERAARTPRRQ